MAKAMPLFAQEEEGGALLERVDPLSAAAERARAVQPMP
jgi:hypothetical protein